MMNKNKIWFVSTLLFVNLLMGFILIAATNNLNLNLDNVNYDGLSTAVNSNSVNQNNGPSISNIQTDRSYFANALGMGESEIKDELIRKFSERRNSDNENVQDIIKIAKLVRAEKRSKISEELLNLTKDFVKRMSNFSDKNLRNKENVMTQIQRYQEVLEQRKKIRLNMSNDKINEFLKDKNRNPQSFITIFMFTFLGIYILIML